MTGQSVIRTVAIRRMPDWQLLPADSSGKGASGTEVDIEVFKRQTGKIKAGRDISGETGQRNHGT